MCLVNNLCARGTFRWWGPQCDVYQHHTTHRPRFSLKRQLFVCSSFCGAAPLPYQVFLLVSPTPWQLPGDSAGLPDSLPPVPLLDHGYKLILASAGRRWLLVGAPGTSCTGATVVQWTEWVSLCGRLLTVL